MDGLSTDPLYVTSPSGLRLVNEPAFEALEAEIAELSGHINAATYRFLELVARFDRNEGWGRWGVASCAQWLNLKCGIGSVAAREKVRVARALEHLPKISDAFRRGQITYSKARAMTRIATPEMEDTLLNIALHGTATHVENLVRKYRRAERLAEAWQAEERHQARYLDVGYDEDGSVTIHAKLPPEIGAVVRQAIEAAMAVVEEGDTDQTGSTKNESNDSAETCVPEPIDGDRYDQIRARRADGLRLLAERFLADESERRRSSTERFQVVVHIDQGLLSSADEDGSRSRSLLPDEHRPRRSEIEDGPVLAVETARRLACDSTLVGIVEDGDGEPLNVGRKTRAISPALKRALKSRDGGCRFPGFM